VSPASVKSHSQSAREPPGKQAQAQTVDRAVGPTPTPPSAQRGPSDHHLNHHHHHHHHELAPAAAGLYLGAVPPPPPPAYLRDSTLQPPAGFIDPTTLGTFVAEM